MQLTVGERGRPDRYRRRPADGSTALARTHQMVSEIYCAGLFGETPNSATGTVAPPAGN